MRLIFDLKMSKQASAGPATRTVRNNCILSRFNADGSASRERNSLTSPNREIMAGKARWIVCFLAVLIPLILSCRRVRRYPARWDGRLSPIVTAFISALNVANAVLAWRNHIL